MTIIASIDVAIKNIGFILLEVETMKANEKILHIEKSNMLTYDANDSYTFTRAAIPRLCKNWVENRIQFFKQCDFVIIEGQMLSKYIQISLVLEALISMHVSKVLILHPTTVKKFFNTKMNDYKQNKKKCIEKCQELLSQEEWQKICNFDSKKKDDICDAVLQALYVARNQNLVEKKYNDVLKKLRPKKKRVAKTMRKNVQKIKKQRV